MEVHAENRGRPSLKLCVSLWPRDGEKLFDPKASGRKGQECPQEIRTKKFMFMLFFLACPWAQTNITHHCCWKGVASFPSSGGGQILSPKSAVQHTCNCCSSKRTLSATSLEIGKNDEGGGDTVEDIAASFPSKA